MARAKEFDENVVLNKAVKLFWDKGYHHTSAQDLVDFLGINRSSIYDTYGDKHSLFLMALQEYRRLAGGRLIEMVETSTDAKKTVVQMFNSLIDTSVQCQTPRGCFMVNSSIELAPHDPDVAEIIDQNRQDIEGAFFRIIKKGQKEGVFEKRFSARALARSFYNCIAGIRVAARSEVDRSVYKDIVKVALSALY